MRVPLLDLSEQYRSLAEPIREQSTKSWPASSFILGPKVNGIRESDAATTAPRRMPSAFPPERMRCWRILMALEIGPGDAVITSAYTFFATGGLHRARRRDADLRRYRSRNLQHLARCLGALSRPNRAAEAKTVSCVTRQGETMRAIVPVHLFGLCCDMDAIHRICGISLSLEVIEDAAQAIGAEYPFGETQSKSGRHGRSRLLQFLSFKKSGRRGRCRNGHLPGRNARASAFAFAVSTGWNRAIIIISSAAISDWMRCRRPFCT